MRDEKGKKMTVAWATRSVNSGNEAKGVVIRSNLFLSPWGVIAAQLAAGRHPTKAELNAALRSGPIPRDIEEEVREILLKVLNNRCPRSPKPLSYYTDVTEQQGKAAFKKAKIVREVVTRYARYGRGSMEAVRREVAQEFNVSEATVKNYYETEKKLNKIQD